MVQTLSYDPITWLPGQPQECAPRGGGNPQNFWVGGTPLRYIGESWCVWAAEKLMFGHCIAHGFGLFSSHLGVRPGSQLRPACGRLVGHGRPRCVPSSRGLAAAGHGFFSGWLGVDVAGPGCGSVPPGLAASGYGCSGEAAMVGSKLASVVRKDRYD